MIQPSQICGVHTENTSNDIKAVAFANVNEHVVMTAGGVKFTFSLEEAHLLRSALEETIARVGKAAEQLPMTQQGKEFLASESERFGAAN